MKKLLATTALVTALIATPAMAEKYVLDANGNFYDRELVTYAHGPAGSERLVVLTSDSSADMAAYSDRTTVLRLDGMTETELRSNIGDLNRDGQINDYDVSIYVGDNNNDGVINYEDYQNRFGEDAIIVEQYSNLDGSTTIATTRVQQDFVPQNEGSSIETRDPYGETDEFAANEPVEIADDFVQQNEGSSIETRDPYGESDEFAANQPVEMADDFVPQNEGSSIETRDPYGETALEESYTVETDSELSLWERFKSNFQ
jgi:hypothetical protein